MFSIEGVKQLKSAFKEIKKTSDTNIKSNINFIRFIERKEKRIIKTFLLKSLRTVVIALIPLYFEKSDLLKTKLLNNFKLVDEIVIDTINELEKVQDTFNTDSIEVLNEDSQFENVCEVEPDENKNN